MNKPSSDIVEAVAPSFDIEGLPISDGTSCRNVAKAEVRDSLRLPRVRGTVSGPIDAVALVAAPNYYNGAHGGEPGHYLMLWVEWRSGNSRWRTPGVKVRDVEAARLGHDLVASKPSRPRSREHPRIGGKIVAVRDSELRGDPVEGASSEDPLSYLVYVRHRNRGQQWARTRGVEVLDSERIVLGNLLTAFAAEHAPTEKPRAKKKKEPPKPKKRRRKARR